MPREKVQEKLREIARDRLDLEGTRETLTRREAGHRAELEELRNLLGGEHERWPQPDGSTSPNPVEDVWDSLRTIALWLSFDRDERQRFVESALRKVEAQDEGNGSGIINLHFHAGFSIAAIVKTRRDKDSPSLTKLGFGGLGPKSLLGNQGFPRDRSI